MKTCAMIVFYLIGYHTRADMPPIVTTPTVATRLINDEAWIQVWRDLGVYPVIKSCEESI